MKVIGQTLFITQDSKLNSFNIQESHPDVNKDPKASEEFHRVKMAYDRLRSIYEEGEGLKQSREDFERREQERGQGRGNTFKTGVNMNNFRCNIWKSHIFVLFRYCTHFKNLQICMSQGFKSWSKDDWMNKVAEEGRKRQQYYKEENKYSGHIKRFFLISTVLARRKIVRFI